MLNFTNCKHKTLLLKKFNLRIRTLTLSRIRNSKLWIRILSSLLLRLSGINKMRTVPYRKVPDNSILIKLMSQHRLLGVAGLWVGGIVGSKRLSVRRDSSQALRAKLWPLQSHPKLGSSSRSRTSLRLFRALRSNGKSWLIWETRLAGPMVVVISTREVIRHRHVLWTTELRGVVTFKTDLDTHLHYKREKTVTALRTQAGQFSTVSRRNHPTHAPLSSPTKKPLR